MAKKKSSSSKITITKATTVKTPTIKSYTPSKAVNAAKSTLQKTEKARPAAYTSKYGTQITGLADAIANRKGFSYDYTKDALYQNYKDQYQRQAQLGMQNATAQAAALSGGYGNSYAATAGNLAYQENMSALNNIIPSLYEAAYNRYQTDLDNQRSDLSMYQGLDESDYAKYQIMYCSRECTLLRRRSYSANSFTDLHKGRRGHFPVTGYLRRFFPNFLQFLIEFRFRLILYEPSSKCT